MKTFGGDFDIFLNKIKDNENFGITRFGDGELSIIEGNGLNLLAKGAGEFAYNPRDEKYSKSRDLLEESFKYQEDNYFVGIACRCCVGDDKFKHMKDSSEQNEDNLTWANIFVNSNYPRFINEMVPELKKRKIILVCHEASTMENLPFEIESLFLVKPDAWLHNLDLIDILKKKIDDEELENIVFLISAGPLANILVQQLHKHNNRNTYIDVGSVFDGYLGLPITRGYLKGAPTLKKVCIW